MKSISIKIILLTLMLYFEYFQIGKADAQDKPNIVLILADDLGYYSIGANGQELIKTPHIDKIAQKGIRFTNFYANALCSPSRGSLMTGMHTGHGLIRGNHELGEFADSLEYGQMPLPLNIITLGKKLKAAGYATAVMGKWGLGGPNSTGAPTLHGIDLFFGYLDQKQAHNYYPTHLWKNGKKVLLPNQYFDPHQKFPEGKDPNDPASYSPYSGKVYSADIIHEEAMKFVREKAQSGQPFFLEMAYTLPHMALQVPERVLTQYIGMVDDKPYLGDNGYLPNQTPRATYAAMITLLDEYVGDLMQVLKQQDVADNTLVIFTADNGAATVGGCDSDYFNCSGELRGRKASIYEGGIKVPFVACWPGVIKPNTTSGHISAIWDLMPTLLDVAGMKAVKGINGISFLPVLMEKDHLQKEHEFLYWERHTRSGKHRQAVRFGNWKAVKKSEIALYNLKEDPSESNNVADQHPEIVEKAISYFNTRKLAVIPEWNFYQPAE